MARSDVIVLGAGIVGTSIAVHLVKRGLTVALIDRAGVGEGTSYGNAGVIEGNTIVPPAFPSDWGERLRVVFKRSPQANYHLLFLPKVAPWLWAFYAASQPSRLAGNPPPNGARVGRGGCEQRGRSAAGQCQSVPVGLRHRGR